MTYDVTTNTNWSALSPTPTNADTIVVHSPATLTQDVDGICNTLTINSGATLTETTHNLTMYGTGTFTNNGAFNCGTGTVIFDDANGSSVHTVSGFATLYNMTAKSGGIHPGTHTTVLNNFEIIAGYFTADTIVWYGPNSTLIYNTGASSWGTGPEWDYRSSGTTWSVPKNVSIIGGSNVTINGDGTHLLVCEGNFYIDAESQANFDGVPIFDVCGNLNNQGYIDFTGMTTLNVGGTIAFTDMSHYEPANAVNQNVLIHTITLTQAGAGLALPYGAKTLETTETIAFHFYPNSGQSITSVTVDGTGQGTPSSYTFTNVSANHTLVVEFSGANFTITATQSTGGTITPSGVTTVNAGANQVYTVLTQTGYVISQLTIDGTPQAESGCGLTYTFSNIQANHTIAATFAKAYLVSVPAIAVQTVSVQAIGVQYVKG